MRGVAKPLRERGSRHLRRGFWNRFIGKAPPTSTRLGGSTGRMNFLQNLPQAILVLPVRIMGLKPPHVADVPDVIAVAIVRHITPVQLASADLLAQRNRLQHRTVRVPAAAQVAHLATSRRLEELPKCRHQVMAVNVVAHLLALIAKDTVSRATY